jgi:hypothetical protein
MDLFTDMIKDVYRKIDSANTSFCSTPTLNTKKLTGRIARSILLGKGDVDDLLTSAGSKKQDRCRDKRVCTHE